MGEGAYYYDAIKWAAENGIVKGYGDSRYDPEATVTRQDLAVIFLRYAKFAEISLPELRDYPDFDDDNAISDYAKEAVEAFYRAEILNGKPDNMFDPQGGATRAEFAAVLHRFLGLVAPSSTEDTSI